MYVWWIKVSGQQMCQFFQVSEEELFLSKCCGCGHIAIVQGFSSESDFLPHPDTE